jgi:hypothetical protein
MERGVQHEHMIAEGRTVPGFGRKERTENVFTISSEVTTARVDADGAARPGVDSAFCREG